MAEELKCLEADAAGAAPGSEESDEMDVPAVQPAPDDHSHCLFHIAGAKTDPVRLVICVL